MQEQEQEQGGERAAADAFSAVRAPSSQRSSNTFQRGAAATRNGTEASERLAPVIRNSIPAALTLVVSSCALCTLLNHPLGNEWCPLASACSPNAINLDKAPSIFQL